MKKSETESDATDSHPGTDSGTANCPTMSTEHFATTPKPAQSGAAENATPSDIPGPSSPLSDAEQQNLARIRKDRRNGFMVSAPDVDFLLEVLERLNQ